MAYIAARSHPKYNMTDISPKLKGKISDFVDTSVLPFLIQKFNPSIPTLLKQVFENDYLLDSSKQKSDAEIRIRKFGHLDHEDFQTVLKIVIFQQGIQARSGRHTSFL